MKGHSRSRRTCHFSLACLLISASAFPAPSDSKWQAYADSSGSYTFKYPANWQVLTKGKAVLIKSPGGPSAQGIFGITPRAAGVSIEESVTKEFADPNRSKDLVKSMARIANRPATKVVGSKKNNPNIKIVEYYVLINSRQYYLLFQAPKVEWSRHSPTFDEIIASIRFLK